jgi:hypothetical protein
MSSGGSRGAGAASPEPDVDAVVDDMLVAELERHFQRRWQRREELSTQQGRGCVCVRVRTDEKDCDVKSELPADAYVRRDRNTQTNRQGRACDSLGNMPPFRRETKKYQRHETQRQFRSEASSRMRYIQVKTLKQRSAVCACMYEQYGVQACAKYYYYTSCWQPSPDRVPYGRGIPSLTGVDENPLGNAIGVDGELSHA